MPELNKVIDYFQAALRMKNEHGFCILPFETVEDTIELLKAQEPLEPVLKQFKLGFHTDAVRIEPCCGGCGRKLETWYKYCPECGRAVERDETL